jgi:hypothetical protein
MTLLVGNAWAAGQLSIGASYDGWNSNYVSPSKDSGWEVFTPVSLGLSLDPQLGVYVQGEFATANYISTSGTAGNTTVSNISLTNVSDTVLGGKYTFNSFGLKSVFEAAVNIPSGDPSWEDKAQLSEPPVQFIDDRYTGRGLGLSGFYGLSLPDGRGEYSVGAGYLYAGAFNPNFNQVTNEKLGDAVFLAVNRVTPFQNDENEIFRVSAYQSFPTYESGQNIFQLGTNFNASYNWSNPKALSFEVGGQVYLPSSYNGTTESHNSNGPRVYASSTYAFDDLALTGRAKYIFQNDYPTTDPLAQNSDGGGGWQLGFEPSYRFRMDDSSFLRISGSIDYIYANNYGQDANANLTSVTYLFWAAHTEYVWKL